MQSPSPPTPPTPPIIPPPPPAMPAPAPVQGQPSIMFGPANDPAMVLEGLRAQRRELRNQLEALEERRHELSEQLQDPMVGGADRKGLEQRITDIDARISATDQQIAAADLEVARAAAVPGAVMPDQPHVPQGPPEEFFVLGGLFMIVVLLPLSIAHARRIWRRGAAVVTGLPAELYERLTRIEHSVESVAIEVERIGEGQRFMTRVFTEGGDPHAIGAGPAQPVERNAPEASQLRR